MPIHFMRSLVFLLATTLGVLSRADAQLAPTTLSIPLSDVHIVADQLVRGDDDIYGLGDWRCQFKVSLEGRMLKIEGEIVFAEKANDFTTIRGSYYREIPVVEPGQYPSCQLELEEPTGLVSGPNIGARGYRWYKGEGLIRQARIITDTFGPDTGRIGGTVQLEPLRIRMSCAYAGRSNQ